MDAPPYKWDIPIVVDHAARIYSHHSTPVSAVNQSAKEDSVAFNLAEQSLLSQPVHNSTQVTFGFGQPVTSTSQHTSHFRNWNMMDDLSPLLNQTSWYARFESSGQDARSISSVVMPGQGVQVCKV